MKPAGGSDGFPDPPLQGHILMKRLFTLFVALIVTGTSDARAGLLQRIGDIDGFGYGAAPGFRAANGGPANANGSPVLDNGDFLPDVNRSGDTSTGSGDDFDL